VLVPMGWQQTTAMHSVCLCLHQKQGALQPHPPCLLLQRPAHVLISQQKVVHTSR
jgi:hypothetical protein